MLAPAARLVMAQDIIFGTPLLEMLAPEKGLVIVQDILWRTLLEMFAPAARHPMLLDMEELLHDLFQNCREILERAPRMLTRHLILMIVWEKSGKNLQKVRKEIFTIEPKFFSIRYIQQYVFRCIILLIQGTAPKFASSGFSKFRKRNRPPSSTMPWTIWPSLVVLWGVCWMFYNPLNSAEGEQFERLFLETDTTLDSTADPGINRSTLLQIFNYANKPLQKSISSQLQHHFCPIMALSTA